MRIGISALNLSFDRGFANAGMSRYCFGLIDALMRSYGEHEFHVFVNRTVEIPPDWKADKRFFFHRPRGPARGSRIISEIIGGSLHVAKIKPDAYLSTSIVLPLRCPCPKGLVVHDLFPLTHPEMFTATKAKVLAQLNGWSMNRSDVVVANSHHTKSQILQYYRYSSDKVVVAHLGLGNAGPALEPSMVADSDLERAGVPFKRFVFTIGTLEPRKNLSRLIEAFAKVVSKIDPDIGLVIGGGKGWKESGIFDAVRKLGLENRVVFLGYVPDDDVPKLFARCEFYVFPSTIEGFGIPSLEAHHFGAPLVSSNAGALPEVAGPAAVLFNPHSVDLMADALLEGFKRRNERGELVEKGRAFATQFSWDACAKTTMDALTALVPK